MDATKQGQGGPAATPPEQARGKARWLIWSREHTAFWRPLQIGYTVNLDEAGRYDTLEAQDIVARADRGPRRPGELAPELMILAPECAPGQLLLDAIDQPDREAIAGFLACTGLEVDANSHGALDALKLVQMLLEDVALMIHRPGSWEGANMRQVMASHGYTAHEVSAIAREQRRRYFGGKSPYDPEPQP